MELKKQNVLLFTRTMKLGGTENVVLQICEILNPLVNNLVVCSCGGVNTEKLQLMGIKHYNIPDIEIKTPLNILKTVYQLNKIIYKENITVLHTHHRMAAFYTHLIPKHGIVIISTLHGIFFDKHILTRFAYSNTHIIACGNVVKKNFIEEFKFSPNEITVIHNAIRKDNSEIKTIPCLLQKENIFLVGYIGRLSKEKGVEVLVNVIEKVKLTNKKIQFIFVGNGPLEYNLKKKIAQLKIEDSVSFLGYRNDAQNIIKQLDLIILPSFTEGFPLTPIEAFANGKPIIATAVGGTTEIVQNGINGILIPPGDENALLNAINHLYENRELLQNMSLHAKQTFEEHFSFETFYNSIVNYYKNL